MTRRDALRRIAAVTGSATVASALLAACGTPVVVDRHPTAGPSATSMADSATPEADFHVGLDDPAIEAGDVEFEGDGVTLLGHAARPQGEGSFPLALVCHENRGLTEHIKDVTRRLARAGYAALAVDLLSRQGGIARVADPPAVPGILGSLPDEQLIADFRAGMRYLQAQPYADRERLGMTGFCYGGAVTWRFATQSPELLAAVPYYGRNPPLEDVPKIQAAVLGIYGGLDTRITSTVPQIEDAMRANGKTFENIVYPDAGHAFHNDTGSAYNPEAARDAWRRTLAWFDQYLRA